MDNSNDFATGVMLGENRNGNCNGWGNGMFGMEWLFALLILPAITNGGFYGNNNRGVAEPVTESGLCNAMNFNNLEGAVGRLGDQVANVNTNLGNAVCNLGYETLRNFNALEQLISSCCCNLERIALENRYQAAQNTAEINATTVSTGQKVLDAICGLRMEMKDDRIASMQNQINQLQLNAALCGVVRYPNQTTFNAGFSPFFGWNNNCNNCCGNGNI